MTQLKTLTLCADDFGLNPGVSQGILQLINMQRLSAVSCMVNMPDFQTHALQLVPLKNKVQCGLHFNMTEGYFISAPQQPCFGLNELLIKTHLGLIKSSFIEQELNAQLDRYTQLMGSLPDFIDGHQHVHQFPKIRAIILKVYEQRLKANNSWIRTTYPAYTLPQFQFKGRVLALTGGKSFYHQLKYRRISHNDYFSGVYDFNPSLSYRALFRGWLNKAQPNTLIMCHPGYKDGSHSDAIALARTAEWSYLASDEFLEDCAEYNVHLTTGPKSG
jgi:predicted glycoside hydrolase/deacetylase ChbG (UPF0249 family)